MVDIWRVVRVKEDEKFEESIIFQENIFLQSFIIPLINRIGAQFKIVGRCINTIKVSELLRIEQNIYNR